MIILLIASCDSAEDYLNQQLSPIAEIVRMTAKTRVEFIEQCKAGVYDGVYACYRTYASVRLIGRFDKELIAHLPKSWIFLSHVGAGYDQIDIQPCSDRQPPIRVSNTPVVVDDATADTGMFLMLGALRNFNPGLVALRANGFRGDPPPKLGHDPEGMTLGILGMGGIGLNMARKSRAFGMNIQYHNRHELSDGDAAGAKYVSMDELLRTSDVLSLNLPLNPATRHIIGKPEFEKMKDGVVVINTARGAVMDEAALVEALDSGKVASAGLDVFEHEPAIHPGLLKNERCILLPHMGTSTRETLMNMEKWCIDNVRMAVAEGRLKSPVPEQKHLTP